MANGVKIKVKQNFKPWAALKKSMETKTPVIHCKVGVLGSDATSIHPLRDDITVDEVALINEFGTAKVPARPFLRPALYKGKSANAGLKHMLAQVTREALFNKVPRSIGLRKVGEWAVQQVQNKIMSNVGPENAERTIREKGHELTLRHTYTLLSSISYMIFKGSQLLSTGDQFGPLESFEGDGED